MLSSVCRQSAYFSAESTAMSNISEESHDSDFRVFRDYLGLANLVLPGRIRYETQMEVDFVHHEIPQDLPSFESFGRQRINSLDSSDTRSETSSSSRADSEIFDNLTADFPIITRKRTSTSTIGDSLHSVHRKPTLNSSLIGKIDISRSRSTNKVTVCVFCRNNGESREFYSSHTLKDNEGNTTCPILRAYTCPLCKANGDGSHTIKYCPKYTPKHKIEKVISLI